MTTIRHDVRTVVVTVPVDEARAQKDRWLKRHFEQSEASRLSARAPRTLASELALKRALTILFGELAPNRSFTERDFVIGRRPNSAPYVRRFPALRRPSKRTINESLHVSLSHSSGHGCGLAVFTKPVDRQTGARE